MLFLIAQPREGGHTAQTVHCSTIGGISLSASREASLLWKTEACLPMPPVADRTTGTNEALSTSSTLYSYILRFSFSCFWYVAVMEEVLLESACGLKILTSMKVLSYRSGQNPFTATSSQAPSYELAEAPTKGEINGMGWRSSSILTSLQTSVRRGAIRSRISLCLIDGKPPLGHDRA